MQNFMNIFLFNTSWMAFNLYLAFLPIVFYWLFFTLKGKFLKCIFALLWLVYLPNTIYVFTDLHHLVEQWIEVNTLGKLFLAYQYAFLEIIGLTCFLFAFYPLEKVIHYFKWKKDTRYTVLILLNFCIGFAMVLGKIERVNSWDVFLNPQFVILSTISILSSIKMLGLVILFGLFANCFYFLFRNRAKRLYAKLST